jgi:hypothetical protein
MRRVFSAVAALVCVGLLSSCSFLSSAPSPFHDDSEQKAGVQMQHIADAVEHHDAAALKELFSPRAQEEATDLDGGLQYFLSIFPVGRMTWETTGTALTSYTGGGKQATLLYGHYDVSAGGHKWKVGFAYMSVDDFDPKDVGLYALGSVSPADSGWTPSGAKKPYNLWGSQFGMDDTTHTVTGDPGVYVPQD